MRQSKKQLLRAIRKETRPQKGFGQWIFIFEAKKVTDALGLIRVEGYSDKRLEWSGSLSVNLPQAKTFGPDGKELAGQVEWDKLTAGESTHCVLTMEMRGKTLWEGAKDMVKRSVAEGKLQDIFPLAKLGL